VRRTGKIASIPVGDAMIGRVVTRFGLRSTARDRSPPRRRGPWRPRAGIVDRQPVNQRCNRAQGDRFHDSDRTRAAGAHHRRPPDRKTALAIDTILNQRGGDLHCIYVAVGQKDFTVAKVVKVLEDAGAMSYTTVVSAGASESAPLQYIAPYTGCAIGEEFRDAGKHAPRDLRRSFEARAGLPAALAPPAPSAGARGVPGGHLLSPLATLERAPS